MRDTRRPRTRGSWAARLVGLGFVVLLAGAGVVAYLFVGTRTRQTAAVLPTRVLSTQAVGLVMAGPPTAAGSSPAPQMLIASGPDLTFVADGPAGAAWTSDQMAGGTYIFIYLQNGLCLAPKSSSPGAAAVVLKRCNLQASQRWIREHRTAAASGIDYWQLRNAYDGRCLAAVTVTAIGGSVARLQPCAAPPGREQLIAFMTSP